MASADALTSGNVLSHGDDFEYRPLSVTAVASLVFGVLSSLIFFAGRDGIENALMLTPLPLLGIGLGLKAVSQLRANPDQYTGGKYAKVGVALSAICLTAGMSYSGVVYATEVPDGYIRSSFAELRPDEVEARGDTLIPAAIQKVEGKKIFIKGYMRPGDHRSAGGHPVSTGIANFLLVRDSAQCCYGDINSVKYYDRMFVSMATPERLSYHGGVFRVGGTLRLHPENARDGSALPTYVLEADYVK